MKQYVLYSYHDPFQPCDWCVWRERNTSAMPAIATHQVTNAADNARAGYICDACIPQLNTATSTVLNPV